MALPLCATSVFADSTLKLNTDFNTTTNAIYDIGFYDEFEVDSSDQKTFEYRYVTDNNFVIDVTHGVGEITMKTVDNGDVDFNADINSRSLGLGLGYAFKNNLNIKDGTGLISILGLGQINTTTDVNYSYTEKFEDEDTGELELETTSEPFTAETETPYIFLDGEIAIAPHVFAEYAATMPFGSDEKPSTYSVGLGYNVTDKFIVSVGINRAQLDNIYQESMYFSGGVTF